jgi:hypothetical protein
MDPAIRRLIEALHQVPPKCVLAVTGGGAQAAGLLLSVPGGSRTVLETIIPYHDQALCDYLGRRPAQFCSVETARAMAVRAAERAEWLAPGESVVGVGCTASLASDRPKRGDHRFHVAISAALLHAVHSLTLSKGARDREGEEAVLDAVLLNALAEAFGVAERLELPLLPGEELHIEREPGSLLEAFYRGELPRLCVEADGRHSSASSLPPVLLPGAFNPLHRGHLDLAAVAGRLSGLPVAYELSVTNVDKPTLALEEARRRLAQFGWQAPVWLTRAPTFVEKARLFPGAVFVIGHDTAARILAPRYYQDSPGAMTAALQALRDAGCRFLVAGRLDAKGRFLCVEDLSPPEAFRDLFHGIAEEHFRLDLSSTQLRQQTSAHP